jgi:hypothetical protein
MATSWTSMKTHFENCVGWKEKREREAADEMAKADYMPPVSKNPMTQAQLRHLNDLIVKLVVCKNLPFRLVESQELQEVFHYLNPTATVYQRTALTNAIKSTYLACKRRLQDMLQAHDSRVGFTTDMWTAPNRSSFLSVTAHWITPDFTRLNFTLAMVAVHERHTARVIANKLWEVVEEFNVTDRIAKFTIDNGSNMIAALKLLESKLISSSAMDSGTIGHRCMIHVIQLAAKVGLKFIQEQIRKIHDLSVSLRKPIFKESIRLATTNARKAGLISCEAESIPMIPLDVDTRWNSTYDMLEGALRLKPILPYMQQMVTEHGPYYAELDEHGHVKRDSNGKVLKTVPWDMSIEEWDEVLSIFAILTPLKDVTNFLSRGTATVGASMYYLDRLVFIYSQMQSERTVPTLPDLQDEEDRVLSESQFSFVTAVSKKLQEYHKQIFNIDGYIGCVLDPRVSTDKYPFVLKTQAHADEFRRQVSGLELAPIIEPVAKKSKRTYNVLDDDDLLETGVNQSANDEVNAWKIWSEKYTLGNHDWAKIWKDNLRTSFPLIGKLARDYLCVQPSSVSAERSFSRAGLVMTDIRHQISDELMEIMLPLESWLKNGFDMKGKFTI